MNADLARQLVEAYLGETLSDIVDSISEAAANGLMSYSVEIEDSELAAKLVQILNKRGFETSYTESLLQVTW